MLTQAEFGALADAVDRSPEWPAGDVRGALSFITPDAVAAAAASAVRGVVVSCAEPGPRPGARLATRTDAGGDWLAVNETLTLEQHGAPSMTHFDALGHFFYRGLGHAGATPEILRPDGVTTLDVTAAAQGVVGRGLLLDLPRVLGVERVEAGVLVTQHQVDAWLTSTGAEPRPGDLLFVRTGRPLAPVPGDGDYPLVGALDLECARWVHDSRFSVVVSDAGMDPPTALVEGIPTPWHILTLTKMGISLVDFAHLEALSEVCRREDRQTFLAVLPVLPLTGATASPVNPLAVF